MNNVVEADAVVMAEGEIISSKRRALSPGISTQMTPPGSEYERGTYAGVAQEPGRSRRHRRCRNERVSESETRARGRDVGAP